MTKAFRVLVPAAIAIGMLTACSSSSSNALAPVAPVLGNNGLSVTTDKGVVNGSVTGGLRTFLGIPYAAPPTGQLRFAPPQPHAPWTTPISATQPGNVCPQQGPPLAPFGLNQQTTEDCLTLNVTAPAGGGGSPVMIWIHGGAFTQGSGAFYPAAGLVNTGHIVVVTINYRLGLLGYLADAAFATTPGQYGNYGLEDQIAALQWVHKNIGAFGGNPSNVTIAGESAGAISVCGLIENAASGGPAAGLFQRGIVESGPCQAAMPTLAGQAAIGSQIAAGLGCAGGGSAAAACLRALPLDTILNAQASLGLGAISPSVGGTDIPQEPKAAIGTVPLLLGGNKLEWGLFVALGQPPPPADAPTYAATLNTFYGPAGPAVAASSQYAFGNFGSGFLAISTALSDFAPSIPINVCYDVVTWQKQAASARPIYAYEFSDPNAPSTLPFAPFNTLVPSGPLHAAEVEYIFPNIASPTSLVAPGGGPSLTGAEAQLSSDMLKYWTNFVSTGNPNGAGVPNWPKFATATDALQLTSTGPVTGVNVDAEHNCASFWEPLFSSTPFLQ